jgi:hypothetical protein
LLELKHENDSLKLAPTTPDDVECLECDAWFNEIKLLNEKNASTLAKLDALRTDYDELKARPTLLRACKSCPTMHALQGFVSKSTPKKCCNRPKNGSNSTFATILFWLKVVALVTVAIA